LEDRSTRNERGGHAKDLIKHLCTYSALTPSSCSATLTGKKQAQKMAVTPKFQVVFCPTP